MRKFLTVLISVIFLCGCVQNKPVNTGLTKAENAEKPQEKIETSGLSNKKYGWGFRKIEGERPEFTKDQTAAMEKYGCIYLGSGDEKNLYLTFDEGYEAGYTAPILDVLKKHGVKAAFFVTGHYMEKETALIDRMVAEGHIVGNHTVHHPSLPDKSDAEVEKELTELNDIFENRYGFSMRYSRPPMGEYSERTLAIEKNLGYRDVFWSFAYKDWEKDNQKGADYAFGQVTKGLHNGAVILLHAVSKDNADALDRIITYALENGYSFKNLDEYK